MVIAVLTQTVDADEGEGVGVDVGVDVAVGVDVGREGVRGTATQSSITPKAKVPRATRQLQLRTPQRSAHSLKPIAMRTNPRNVASSESKIFPQLFSALTVFLA